MIVGINGTQAVVLSDGTKDEVSIKKRNNIKY